MDKATKKSDAKKFKRKWKGPCDVLERTSPVNYKIKPRNGRVRIEHVNRLQKFHIYSKPENNIETIIIDEEAIKKEHKDSVNESHDKQQHTVDNHAVSKENQPKIKW